MLKADERRGQGKRALALTLFLAIGFLALTLPGHPGALRPAAFLRLPLELPLAGFLLVALPRRPARAVALAVTLAAFALLFLAAADIGVQAAFQRPFNPYLDAKMIADGWNVLSGALGKPAAALVVGAAILFLAALVLLFHWAVSTLATAPAGARRRLALGFAGLGVAGLALLALGPRAPLPAQFRAGSDLAARVELAARSAADLRAFKAELARADGPRRGEGLFSAVEGRDVVLVFIESYGRSAVEDPRYAPTVQPRLAAIGRALESAGFASASAWLRSPTVGGLSWLAHATFLSGRWIDSQARYDRLLGSTEPSLNRLFAEAGWESVAVMPAITMDWPEAAWFGYDRILASKDLGYRGAPFNWVTMPDQYTLSAFERLARRPAGGRPVMAEIALISSHAPWTPVPEPVAWEAVGDGTVFTPQAQSGDPPAVVWADPERVRRHYAATVDYALAAIGDYIARFGRDAVFILLGDHQPAAIVTGPQASRDVPVHIVSADRALVARLAERGFDSGMLPDARAAGRPMSAMRDLLVEVFGSPPAEAAPLPGTPPNG